MEIFLVLVFLLWLYSYWRFTGKRKYFRAIVVVTEGLHANNPTEKSYLELACAYMQAQRYADAYKTFADILNKYPNTMNKSDILRNMDFCKKPLPWSSSLENHNMGYWHNFMLVRFGRSRKIMISQETCLKADNMIP